MLSDVSHSFKTLKYFMSNLLILENLNYYFKTHECSGSKNQEASWTARYPPKAGFATGFYNNSRTRNLLFF